MKLSAKCCMIMGVKWDILLSYIFLYPKEDNSIVIVLTFFVKEYVNALAVDCLSFVISKVQAG